MSGRSAVAQRLVRFHPSSILLRNSADRKSTRLNSSHSQISYAVFCLKKKKTSSDDARVADLRHQSAIVLATDAAMEIEDAPADVPGALFLSNRRTMSLSWRFDRTQAR